MNTQPAYTTAMVSKLYSVHVNTVRRLVKSGKLKAGHAGSNFRFDPAECDRIFKGITADNAA